MNLPSLRRLVLLPLWHIVLLFAADATAAGREPVLVGLDGEFGHISSTSAEAVRYGIRIAIDEINQAGGVLQGRPLELVEKANGSLPARSAANLREFAAMPNLVAVYCGRFSPTVLETLPLVHEIGLPLLDPWAAADAIIDNNYSPNFAFRLSLRDSWAAEVMLSDLARRKISRVGLLMLNTSWGRGTKKAAEDYLARKPGVGVEGTQWIHWDDTEESMLYKYQQLRRAGAQAIMLTANADEGKLLARAMLTLPPAERLPVVSHWGVTGGNLPALVGEDFYQLDFRVVQTYSFIGQRTPAATRVVAAYNRLAGGKGARDVKSPVGVAHAYDLTHLLARAIDLAGSTDRRAIRDALERLPAYDGLIKRYAVPFTAKRHEALSPGDVFMARYSTLDGALERQP